jgi:hypothetical protein
MCLSPAVHARNLLPIARPPPCRAGLHRRPAASHRLRNSFAEERWPDDAHTTTSLLPVRPSARCPCRATMASLARLAQATPTAPPRCRNQEELLSRGASLGMAAAATHIFRAPRPTTSPPRATTTVVASTSAYARLGASQPRRPCLRAHGVTTPKPVSRWPQSIGHRPRPCEAPRLAPGRSQPPHPSVDPATGTLGARMPALDPAFQASAATSCPLRRSRWPRPPRHEGEGGPHRRHPCEPHGLPAAGSSGGAAKGRKGRRRLCSTARVAYAGATPGGGGRYYTNLTLESI